MNSQPSPNWRLRIGFLFSTILGVLWGFFLNALLTRLNSYQSPWLVLFEALPLAFFGSMVAGVAFNRMLQSWHKLARLFAGLCIVAIGLPAGIVWGIVEQSRDVTQIITPANASIWYLEWGVMAVGVLAGMWPRWTFFFLRPIGRLLGWLFAKPLDFFESLGRAILWLPLKIYNVITAPFRRVSTPSSSASPIAQPEIVATTAALPAAPPRRVRHLLTRRPRKTKPKPVQARSNGNGNHNDDVPRVTGVVEDRCPYCFDIVKRSDPRGVKKCPVCGAPHHADCWAVTGKCQVPHLNT
jgi:hypothetical protein